MNVALLTMAVNKGSFTFEVTLPDAGDTFLAPGDGVDDIDILIDLWTRVPKVKISLDVGVLEGSFQAITPDELVVMRAAYVTRWGEVDKPW